MTHRSILRPAVSLCAAIALSVVAIAAVPGTQQQPPAHAARPGSREGSGMRSPATAAARRGSPCPISSPLTPDAETQGDRRDASAQVLWDDLDFEREFYMIPRDTYALDPARRRRSSDVPFDRWRELGADGLVIGTVQKTATGVTVEVRLLQRRAAGSAAFAKEYSGSAANPRVLRAHDRRTRSTSSSAT